MKPYRILIALIIASLIFSSCSPSPKESPSTSANTAGEATSFPTENPYPPESIWGYATPTPTVEDGIPVKVEFQVALPVSDTAPSLVIGDTRYPLVGENGYYHLEDSLPAVAGETLQYHYVAGDLTTQVLTATVHSDAVIQDGLNWEGQETYAISEFIKGYGMMDFGGFNVSALRGGSLPDTIASMKNNNGEWFMYDYYWSYTDYTIPEIVDESQFPSMQYPTSEDLARMVQEVHQGGLKYILLASLEWSAIPGNPCFQYHGDADKLAECSNAYWLEGRAYEVEMLDRLTQNPTDEEALQYKANWFKAYGEYLMYFAKVAEETGMDMVVLGKNTRFADSPIHEAEWEALIQQIREIYHGKLAIIYECYDDACLKNKPWVNNVDYAVLFYWFRLSEADDPSYEDLQTEFLRLDKQVITPFYQQYNIPIVLLTPFMSRDHPARQDWVEPASSAPDVGRDLEGQAELYQLLFETSISEPWFNGVIPYGYWFFDGFNVDFAFDRSYNVRNKPASLILRLWFDQIVSE